MRKAIFIVAIFLFLTPWADACVGKNLVIGVVNSPEGQVLAEMLSAIITERTGTTVTVKFYKGMQEIYGAVTSKQVDISIENTSRAMRLLNRPAVADAKKALEVVKSVYEKDKGLVWLKPFGFLNGNGAGSPSYTAAILRAEIINNFPVLPRVVEKLGSAISDETYARLIASVESGEKPKKVARDFLKSRKLI